MSADTAEGSHKKQSSRGKWKLAIGALGVVYGDIGTSPLYAIKECFDPAHGIPLIQDNVFGVLSLVFWALMLDIVVKYLIFVLRADNHGEGGIIALLALLIPTFPGNGDRKSMLHRTGVIFLGLIGAALLYGDGVITPAISVLSAVEGLRVATPAFQPVVVPLTIAILLVLFAVQSRGTARIASIFGPATFLWFLAIAAAGIPAIIQHPEILQALNPIYAVRFFASNGLAGFLILSAVILCITGGEALYADMGHFGRAPIRLGWFSIVFPCLLINYFGQGALILERGNEVIGNPFYGLVEGWALYPMVGLATMATVIASQALITGAFSLTQQAVQLGYLPRITITHTSRYTEGQIFVPTVNRLLMISCCTLVAVFHDSSNLAAAYGVAVTSTMVITSILFYNHARRNWNWPIAVLVPLVAVFLTVDLAFFTANISKVFAGGWVPILIGITIFTVMTTWSRGREVLSRSMLEIATPLGDFLKKIEEIKPPRVKGTAVFMTLTRDIAPSVLLHHFKHSRVLHEKVILLSVITENRPEVSGYERVRVTDLELGFVKVIARYGYMESPDISEILDLCEGAGLTLDRSGLSFYLGRETFLTTGASGLASWRKKIFVFLSRNARPATDFFGIPPDRVIEIGSQIRI